MAYTNVKFLCTWLFINIQFRKIEKIIAFQKWWDFLVMVYYLYVKLIIVAHSTYGLSGGTSAREILPLEIRTHFDQSSDYLIIPPH